ncbi:MAG TPA: hypothetical protein P5080_04250 [Candidatus Paceibacterota bacterium]|nr:hypothetical protein [Candidatus Pacearchaeota archaeon]HRZ51108.1 hypothetical protein [Candidatus Paceibacterota bacterium]HSA36885.1 hypothetical protein [Candidatus Paceibacterota bacterium]
MTDTRNLELLRKAIDIAKRECGLDIKEVFDAVLKYGKLCGNCAEIDGFVSFLLKKEEISRIRQLTDALARTLSPYELSRYVEIAATKGWHPENVFWAVDKFQAKVNDGQVAAMLKSRLELHFDQKEADEFAWIKRMVALSPTDDNVYLAIALSLNNHCKDWAKELLAEYDPSDKVRQSLILLVPKLWAPQYQDEIALWLLGRPLAANEQFAVNAALLDNLEVKRAALRAKKFGHDKH